MSAQTYDEACQDALKWQAQAQRLSDALMRAGYEHSEEILKLQNDNAHLMHWNAGLALDLAEIGFELAQLRGEA